MSTAAHPLHGIDVPICTVNGVGRLTDWNDGAAQLFGRPAIEVLGREWHTVIRTLNSPDCCPLCQTRRVLRQGKPAQCITATLSIGGDLCSVFVIPVPVRFDAQTDISFIILSRAVFDGEGRRPNGRSASAPVRRLDNGHIIDELTSRERDVLACAANGLDARATGVYLGISHATARTYVQRVLSKLGVHNKAQAVHMALTYNLIDGVSRASHEVPAPLTLTGAGTPIDSDSAATAVRAHPSARRP